MSMHSLPQGADGSIIDVGHKARLGVEEGVWGLVKTLEVLGLVGRLCRPFGIL